MPKKTIFANAFSVCRILRVLQTAALTAACGWAQVGTGSIRGAITDPSSAVVPTAHISVKNVQTGITVNLLTDSDGRYVVPGLPIGGYEIQVQAEGFGTAVRQNIVLTVGEEREVNVTLAVGQTSQQIAVQEDAAQLDTPRPLPSPA